MTPSPIAVTAPAPLPPARLEALRDLVSTGRTRERAWRLAQLRRLDTLLGENEAAILPALAEDLGKPPVEAFFELVGVRTELRLALRRLGRWMAPRSVPLPLAQRPGRAQVIAEPLGCVLILGPWNYPFSLTLQPLVSALAAGNTAVLKPSEQAPRTSALIAELVSRHLDPQVVAVVEGDGSVAAALLEQPFDHIFFTGGGRVGRLVMEAAARRLTPVTLELGGKSPVIVLADADLEVTARRIAWGKGLNAGQTCIAPDHLLVEEEVRQDLTGRLAAAFRRSYGEDPLASPDLARIVNRSRFEHLRDLLEQARRAGRLLSGGELDPESLRIGPSLVAVEAPDDPLMAEEIFGPLLPVLPVAGLEEAIASVRSRPKPLALYLFSRDAGALRRLLGATSSGGVAFNDVVLQVGVPDLPFGGVGASGFGAYHGKAGFDTFSHRRSVLRRGFRFDLPLRYPPYAGRLPLLRRLMG